MKGTRIILTDTTEFGEASLLTLEIVKLIDSGVGLYEDNNLRVVLVISFCVHGGCEVKVAENRFWLQLVWIFIDEFILSCDESIVRVNTHEICFLLLDVRHALNFAESWLTTFN